MPVSVENRPVPLFLLLLLALPVFVLALGANSIWDANEAFYVETPRQMVLSGDYVNPSFNAQPRFNKPVLSYWIVAGLYNVFGTSVAVERAGIAAGALGILFATYLIGRALGSASVGALAVLAVATAPRFVMFSRRIFIDIWITCFMALTLACFVLAERHPERRRLYLALMYVAIGLGVLTKGPQALVLPAAAFGLWLVVERRLGDVRRLMLVPGAIIVAAIAAPWWLMQIPEHGLRYIREFWIGENLGRYATSMVPSGRPGWFYLPVLFGDLFPWAPLLVVPILTAWRGRRAGEAPETAAIRRLLWIWIVVIVGAFSTSATKQDLYILPVVPAAGALVAHALVSTGFGRSDRFLRLAVVGVGVLVVVAAAAFYLLLGPGPYEMRDRMLLAAVLAAAGVATLGLAAAGRGRPAVVALAAGFVLFNYVFVLRVLPDAERLKPVPQITAVLDARAAPNAVVASLGTSLPSLVYYLDRPVLEAETLDRAGDLLAGPEDVWLVTGESEREALMGRVEHACVALRLPDFAFHSRLPAIVRGVPPQDLVLLHNHCAR
jgi:4-amino-4-deoxy-L-arabinose transferase-like glycosyltransferase